MKCLRSNVSDARALFGDSFGLWVGGDVAVDGVGEVLLFFFAIGLS